MDYYCVFVTALIAMSVWWLVAAVLVLVTLGIIGICFEAILDILVDSIISVLTVWITYTVVSSPGASTFIYVMQHRKRGHNAGSNKKCFFSTDSTFDARRSSSPSCRAIASTVVKLQPGAFSLHTH